MGNFMLGNNIVLIAAIVGIALLWVLINRQERLRDRYEDYSNIKGEIVPRPNGDIWFVFKYTKNQPRKAQVILETYKQGTIVTSDRDFNYIVSDLIDTTYFYEKNDGPYIIYKLISELEYVRAGNHFYGPTQYINGDNNGSLFQDNYYEQIECFRKEMIAKGISSRKIDELQKYPENTDLQKNFLSTYEPVLRSIEVISAGGTLFDILYRLFFGG
ncbi:hypothetical protein HO520_02000 [Streptococcus suis]|nr:hypothetical protein [Streptococcus suis]HEL2060350.1 hypothetical protein [Streptococcus suis]